MLVVRIMVSLHIYARWATGERKAWNIYDNDKKKTSSGKMNSVEMSAKFCKIWIISKLGNKKKISILFLPEIYTLFYGYEVLLQVRRCSFVFRDLAL